MNRPKSDVIDTVSPSTQDGRKRRALRSAVAPALVTIVATVAAFCTVYAISQPLQAGPNAAVLSAVLALTQGRRGASRHHSPWMKLATFPIVALVVSVVGWLLHHAFDFGALVFIAAMAFSIWSRQRGETMRRVGGLAALPLIAVLVAPAPPHAPAGHLVDMGLIIVAGITAYAWSMVLNALAKRIGIVADEPETRFNAIADPPPRKKATISPHTRMALQMAVALTAAFVIGHLFFAQHWSWIVLTAFIVCSGSVSRGDALYKGCLRLIGAAAGTLAAAAVYTMHPVHGPIAAAVIFSVLFIGLSLRDSNYAWWAACVTLAIAVLQSSGGHTDLGLLHIRLLEILIGAVCGVAATWFVLPIPTEALVRRRIADALLALDVFVGEEHATAQERQQKLATFEACIVRLDATAPMLQFTRHVMLQHRNGNHPALWVRLLKHNAHRVDTFQGSRKDLIRAVRHARKTLGQRELPLSDPLRHLSDVLEADALTPHHAVSDNLLSPPPS